MKRGGAVKTKATERRKLVKALDAVCREWVMATFDRCVCCGSTDRPQCGHLFSRVAYSTRWDKRNLYRQCASDNLRHEYDFIPLLRYAESVWGVEEIERLHSEWYKAHKYTNADLQDMLDNWRQQSI